MNFFGVSAHLKTNSEELLNRIEHDFKYFVSTKVDSSHLELEANLDEESIIPPSKKSWAYENISIIDDQQLRFLSYPEGLKAKFNFKNNTALLESKHIHLLHEITYLCLLSRVGKILDYSGIHRIHGMGISNRDMNFVGIGDSGVGKSTTLLSLLDEENGLLSDDIILSSKSSLVNEFPIRIGLCSSQGGDEVRLERRKYGEKFLYDHSKKTTQLKPARNCFYLFKVVSENPRVRKARVSEIFIYLFKYMVIGIGTPQVVEFFWESGITDFYRKTKIFFSRLSLLFSFLDEEFYVYETVRDESSLNVLKNHIKNY